MGAFRSRITLVKELERYGINRAIIFASPVREPGARYIPRKYVSSVGTSFLGHTIARIAAKVASSMAILEPDNESVLNMMLSVPRVLEGYVFINPCLVNALDKLTTYLRLGMAGIKMHLFVHPISLLDRRVQLIVEKADELSLPVLIDLGLRYTAVEEIVELARQYSRATFIVPHLDPINVIDAALKADNIFLDISGFPVTADRLGRAARRLGPERLIYGSDSPREAGGDMGYTIGLVEGLGLSRIDRELIYSENLTGILARRTHGPELEQRLNARRP